MVCPLGCERTEGRLTSEEVRYWKRVFKSNLKVGIEIETEFNGDASEARSKMSSLFCPTNYTHKFGNFGVYKVKSDGSLSGGGAEVCTVGRRVDFTDLYIQYRAIIKVMSMFRPDMNEAAGMHNHLLLDYSSIGGVDTSCLEKNVPGIILRNMFQLVRRYAPELVWITSTVKHARSITRSGQYCDHSTLMKNTPAIRNAQDYISNIIGGSRYRFVNCNHMVTSGDEISRFHLEFRYPDGSVYPAQIAAVNVLHAALILKAIELSELGVINTGTEEYWSETKSLMGVIRSSSGNRLSDPISSGQTEKVKTRASGMLLELKSALDQFDTHVYPILKILADTPISIMRRSMSDEEINDSFDSAIKNMYAFDRDELDPIVNTINLLKITGCASNTQWETKLAEVLSVSQSEVSRRLFKLNMLKPVKFDPEVGSLVFV
jgi:hypothetical protein